MGYEQRVIAPAGAVIGNAMADGGDLAVSTTPEMSSAVISVVVATQGQSKSNA